MGVDGSGIGVVVCGVGSVVTFFAGSVVGLTVVVSFFAGSVLGLDGSVVVSFCDCVVCFGGSVDGFGGSVV